MATFVYYTQWYVLVVLHVGIQTK